MLPRHAAAFDHYGDGELINPLCNYRFRVTGTFLKALAMLPYIRSLGVNTVYLLPVFKIGVDGHKGNMGSPYSIRNHFKFDEILSEPILELDIEDQFKAFVEAAHLLGMNVVLEFAFRIASLDSDWALEHPEWFYWIKENVKDRPLDSKDNKLYGPPVFTQEQLHSIKNHVQKGDFSHLAPPPKEYRNLFVSTPEKVISEDDKIIGINKNGDRSRIPNAFSDWPPDDTQPVWSDATYLKLYDHPNFNYIAYNTVRMYDTELADPKNKIAGLWKQITQIIPYYQKEYGIDGVMIDMGHALPPELQHEIVKSARKENRHFVFWEENFNPTHASIDNGYNAVAGYIPFDEHYPEKLKELIVKMSRCEIPLPMFGTPETHNTPRAASRQGGNNFSKFTWAINCFLPVLPFIHAGFELGEKMPVNTGLGFEQIELFKYPVDKLPLFSEAELPWDKDGAWVEYLRKIILIRDKYFDTKLNCHHGTMELVPNNNGNIISFIRKFSHEIPILVVGNMNPDETITFDLEIHHRFKSFIDLIHDVTYLVIKNKVNLELAPFECAVGILE
jgi:glycosidase